MPCRFTGVDDNPTSNGLLKNCEGLNGSCLIGEPIFLIGLKIDNFPRVNSISNLSSAISRYGLKSTPSRLTRALLRRRIGGVDALGTFSAFATGTKEELFVKSEGTIPESPLNTCLF